MLNLSQIFVIKLYPKCIYFCKRYLTFYFKTFSEKRTKLKTFNYFSKINTNNFASFLLIYGFVLKNQLSLLEI